MKVYDTNDENVLLTYELSYDNNTIWLRKYIHLHHIFVNND